MRSIGPKRWIKMWPDPTQVPGSATYYERFGRYLDMMTAAAAVGCNGLFHDIATWYTYSDYYWVPQFWANLHLLISHAHSLGMEYHFTGLGGYVYREADRDTPTPEGNYSDSVFVASGGYLIPDPGEEDKLPLPNLGFDSVYRWWDYWALGLTYGNSYGDPRHYEPMLVSVDATVRHTGATQPTAGALKIHVPTEGTWQPSHTYNYKDILVKSGHVFFANNASPAVSGTTEPNWSSVFSYTWDWPPEPEIHGDVLIDGGVHWVHRGLVSTILGPSAYVGPDTGVTVTHNASLRISFWLKGENVLFSASPKAYFFSTTSSPRIPDGNNYNQNYAVDLPIPWVNASTPVSFDWIKVDLPFNTGQWRGYLPNFWINATAGTWWMDDLKSEGAGIIGILRRESTPLTITNLADPSLVYVEGQDYADAVDPHLLDGVQHAAWYEPDGAVHSAFYEHIWKASHPCYPEPKITLPAGSRIVEGQQVRVQYDTLALDHNGYAQSCFSDPNFREVMAYWHGRLIAELPEADGWGSWISEVRLGGTCQACLAKGAGGAWIGDYTRYVHEQITRLAPGKPQTVISDEYDPCHNSGNPPKYNRPSTFGAWEYLPPDVTVCNWDSLMLTYGNDGDNHTDFAGYPYGYWVYDPHTTLADTDEYAYRRAATLFQNLGHKQIFMNFYDDWSDLRWQRDLLRDLGQHGIVLEGVMYCSWTDGHFVTGENFSRLGYWAQMMAEAAKPQISGGALSGLIHGGPMGVGLGGEFPRAPIDGGSVV